jgi:hypothetical protein
MTVAVKPSPIAAPQRASLDENTLADAYVYLLGRALVVRQEHMDLAAPRAGYNVVRYNPLGSSDFVNPNFDVAYLEAWIAVDDRAPVQLEIPRISGRYYTAQILDEWGEVIANINERTFPSQPHGKFVLVRAGQMLEPPAGVARIELHSAKAKLLARIELKGDPAGAVALQKQFRLTVLGKTRARPAIDIPMFDNASLLGVELFDRADALLTSALDVSPIAAEMQQKARMIAALVASSAGIRAAAETQLREKVIPEFHDYALGKAALYRNNWQGGPLPGGGVAGRFGEDYRLRTTVNLLGIWANVPEEAQYFSAGRDGDGEMLDGSRGYVIHFAADNLPGAVVNGYWSVILVGVPDYRVVANPLKRYNFNSYSELASEADGSLKIAIGVKPVAGVAESNWLPSPAGKPFSLTFRTYVPKAVVLRGEWSPPPITRVD